MTDVLAHIAWLTLSGVIAAGGALLLTFLLVNRRERVALGLATPFALARFLTRGVFRKGLLGRILATGNEDYVVYVLNGFQERSLWTDEKTSADLRFVAQNHWDWRARMAALSALVVNASKDQRDELRLMVRAEKRRGKVPLARQQLLDLMDSRLAEVT